jgi:hypothetical protein
MWFGNSLVIKQAQQKNLFKQYSGKRSSTEKGKPSFSTFAYS